jgi:hypothetical protein
MRSLLLCVMLSWSAAASAASLHEQHVGTPVAKQFQLGPIVYALPEGQWVLAAKHEWTGTMANVLQGMRFGGVVLFELRGGRVARAVWAWTNIEPVIGTRGWTPNNDPCKPRDGILLHRDLSKNYQDQYCFQISRGGPFMANAKNWLRDARQWLADNRVEVPGALLYVHFAKIDLSFQSHAYYYFNPELEGMASSVESLTKWADEMAPGVLAGFASRR